MIDYLNTSAPLAVLIPMIAPAVVYIPINIKRDAFSNITSVDYGNGLKIDRSFTTTGITQITTEYNGAVIFEESYERNKLNKIQSINTNVPTFKINTSSDFNYDNFKLTKEIPTKLHHRRNNKNKRMQELADLKMSWIEENLSTIKNIKTKKEFNFHYDVNGSLKIACANNKSKSINTNRCFIKLDENSYIYNNKYTQIYKADGLPIAVNIANKIFPVISDHLGSIKVMLTPNGKQVLWYRDFDFWGNKKTYYSNEYKKLAKTLDRLTIWNYAGLIIPPTYTDKTTLYWSRSRVYSPQVKEWLSIDPTIKWNPNKLLNHPGNWYATRYCNNDPLNFVDPSGYKAMTIYYGGTSSANAPMVGAGSSYGRYIEFDFSNGFQVNKGTYGGVEGNFVTSIGLSANGGGTFGVMFGGRESLVGKSITIGGSIFPTGLGGQSFF